MATLVQKINELSAAIGAMLKNNVVPRLLPAELGLPGQVLGVAADGSLAWITPTGGGTDPGGGLEAETSSYATRVAAVGLPLTSETITAVDTWVKALKSANAWEPIKDCGLMIGSNLASALVKIKYVAGTASSLVNTGMGDSNYSTAGGVGWYNGDENDNQGLDTAATIAQLGVSGANLSMGMLRLDYRDESRPWLSDTLDTGTSEAPANIGGNNPGTNDKNGLTGMGPSLRISSNGADARVLFVENGAVCNPYSGTSGGVTTDLGNGHFTMFNSRRFGSNFYATLRAGFYFVGTALTRDQAIAISRATLTLYKTLGRFATKTECAYVGDSITAGFFVQNPNNRWSTKSAVALNRWETNFGVPSSSIRVKNDNAESLIDRYQDIIATAPAEYSVMMGSNDVLTDANADGTPSIIADCKAKMFTVMSALKATGKPVRWNGFPFTPNITLAKATAYETAFGDVARALGIPYCSQYLRMADTGDTAGLLGGDGVHPNDAGMAFLATGDVELVTGKTSRSVTQDIPSVAPAGTYDFNVTMYGAAPGNLVTVTGPAAFPAGVTLAATVTANDTVRVRATNTTGADVDPASGVFKVLLSPLETEQGGSGPGTGDTNTIALLRFNEGPNDTRPATMPNYAGNSLTFANKGNVSGLGGKYSNEGPFPFSLYTEAENGSTMAVLCDQRVTFGPGMTAESLISGSDRDGRPLVSFSSDGTDSADYFFKFTPFDEGGGQESLSVEMKLPGQPSEWVVETAPYTPNPEGTPNHRVVQWRTDGYIEILVNGTRLAVSDSPKFGTMASCVFCPFGSANPVDGGASGPWRVRLGPIRVSSVQRYSGDTYTVPTDYPDGATSGGGDGGSGDSVDIVDGGGSVVQARYTDVAQNYNDADKGIPYRYGPPATKTGVATLLERSDNGSIDYGNGSQIAYQFGTQNDTLHNEFVSNHGCVLYVPDGTKTATNSLTWLASYGIDRRTIYQRPQKIWSNAVWTPHQLDDYIAGNPTFNSATIDPARPEDMACVQTRWTGPSDSGADRMSLVATKGSTNRGAFVFTIGTETAQQRGIVQLAPGMTPTAIEVSPGGEYAFVALWDYVNFVGKIAVISLGGVPYDRTWQNTDNWFDWWHEWMDMCHPGLKNKGGWSFLKVLGYITLPSDMKAPTSLFVQTGVDPHENLYDGNGNPTNIGALASPLEANRNLFLDQTDNGFGRFIHKGGVLVVGSKSEKKVAFYDLAPLINYTTGMYFNSLAGNLETQHCQLRGAGAPASSLGINGKRYLNTTNGDVYLKTAGAWAVTHNIGDKRGLGMGANQWPYTFTEVPAQMPVLIKTVSIDGNVAAIRGTVTYNYWSKDVMRRTPGTPYFDTPNPNYPRVWIVTTDGKLFIYSMGRWVPGVKLPDQAPAASEIAQVGVVTGLGEQVTHAACVRDMDVDLKGVAWSTEEEGPNCINEMVAVNDRKNRRITWVQFSLNSGATGEVVHVMEDSRMDFTTFEHIEPYHVSNKVISGSDWTGKCVRNYRVASPKPLAWDSLGNGAVVYPTLSPTGEHAGTYPLPGRPFQHHTSNVP